MKNIVLSAVALFSMSSFAVAGEDTTTYTQQTVPEVMEMPVVDAGFYLGLAFGDVLFERTVENNRNGGKIIYNPNLDTTYSTLMFQMGYKFNPYLAVEYRYWKGLGDEDITSIDIGFGGVGSADISAYGIYIKPTYPVTDVFDIYAFLGYAVSTYEVNYGNTTADTDKDDLSWGFGLGYSFTENVSMSLDYVLLSDNSYDELVGVDGIIYDITNETLIDTVNIAITYKF